MDTSVFTLPQATSPFQIEGLFGLEKENLRVNPDGTLALTPHPKALGDKLKNPYITVDFSESQLEMITPPLPSIEQAHGFLSTIHEVVSANIGEELLWPSSMPPILPEAEDEVPLANFGQAGKDFEAYRNHLSTAYGRKKQLISGIHFNISPTEAMLQQLFEQSDHKDRETFEQALYLKVMRQMMRYRWIPLMLTGNSPVAHHSFLNNGCDMLTAKGDTHTHEHSHSIRTSICGYKNKEEFFLNYSSWKQYKSSIQALIQQGKLKAEKELYLPFRIKQQPETNRISHLEIRILDLNPTVDMGLQLRDLALYHLFFLWALYSEEQNAQFTQAEQFVAYRNQYQVACCGTHVELWDAQEQVMVNQKELVGAFLQAVKNFLPKDLPTSTYHQAIAYFEQLNDKPEGNITHKIRQEAQKQGFIDYHLNLAKTYRQQAHQHGFQFKGLEQLELSTQLMLREAIKRGITFELIDPAANFVKFTKDGKTEFVQQATKTSLDTYSGVLMMENKVVTKKVLHQAGVQVPLGADFDDPQRAKQAFARFANQPIVIKPKSTNFGLGISILKENNEEALFLEAIEAAFNEDDTILIEPFIAGREFRIFVIGEEVVGILHRVPANVVGDGNSTIATLVEKKNLDPLRGVGYRTPLEKIRLGAPEKLFLATQGLTFEDVPKAGEVVFLRENSNISTGGDSIDFTDDIHPSYKQIALDAAKAMGVKITGLDMMIQEIDQPATAQNYSVIEMNFNPAIHIHCHPYKGKNRHLDAKMMDILGF